MAGPPDSVIDPAAAWVAAAVASIVGAGSGSPSVVPLPDGVPAAKIVHLAQRHKVLALLTPHLSALGCSDELTRTARAALRRLLIAAQSPLGGTSTVHRALSEAGVEHLVVKGLALGALLGHGAATRPGSDVDVWFRPEHLEVAIDALVAQGWAIPAGAQRFDTPWRRRLLIAVVPEYTLRTQGGAAADLHWRLCRSAHEIGFGFEEALARSVEVTIDDATTAGTTVRTLCAEHALEHMAQHGRKEGWLNLRQFVDIVELAAVCGDDVTAQLAAERPNVRVALLAAAHLAPNLAEIAGAAGVGNRAERLASASWERCLDSRTRAVRRSDTPRRQRWPAAAELDWWLVRSAPTPRVALDVVRARTLRLVVLATRPTRPDGSA
jgi:hypothetical protein